MAHPDLVLELLKYIRAAENKMREGAEEFQALVRRLQGVTGGRGAVSRRRGGRGARKATAGGRRLQKGSLPARVLAHLESHAGYHSSAALLEGLALPKKKRQQLASTLSHLKRDGLLKHSRAKGYSAS